MRRFIADWILVGVALLVSAIWWVAMIATGRYPEAKATWFRRDD